MRKIVRKLKKRVHASLGKELSVKPDILCKKQKFGTDYGGWDIVTSDVNRNSIVYSLGVGEDASFDLALINNFELSVHAFDPTPKSIRWVKQQDFTDRFIMHEYGIAAFDGHVSFKPPDNPDHVSHTMLERPSTEAKAISVPVKRLESIMHELGHDQIDILKMDIEGAEYDVINDISQSAIRPHQILIEFHHRFPSVGIKKTKTAIDTIKSLGYSLFSVSTTNEEFCFIRKPECRAA